MATILFVYKEGVTSLKDFPTDASARRYARQKGIDFAFRDGNRIYPREWVPTPHDFITTDNLEPDTQEWRQVVLGGLAVCKTCKGAEGTLPTECPGGPMSNEVQNQIYQDKIDFKDGYWQLKQTSTLTKQRTALQAAIDKLDDNELETALHMYLDILQLPDEFMPPNNKTNK